LTNVVIDKDALGWEDEHKEDLRIYSLVIPVSKHPDLQQRISDQTIATYCIEKHCDLITADTEFYMHAFDAGAETLRIKRLGERRGKYIYLIQFQ